ncbi:hypothetical protein K7432_003868 [Basidiobolus ranarum]|uniref:Gustatory receptor n=1 Tax=Basidiobolus ranarum TaxID=34480 RepID=A0ABR2W5R8_9FUNG
MNDTHGPWTNNTYDKHGPGTNDTWGGSFYTLQNVILSIFGKLLMCRIQSIPSKLTAPGVIREYISVLLLPMDPVRNLITQFIEIQMTKNHDSQIESVLRSVYDGSAYWMDVTPRAKQFKCYDKLSVVGYGSRLKNAILHPFYKHNVYVPAECQALVKISKEEIPLLLRHKFTIPQSRIAQDTTLATKVCYVAITLIWIYEISTTGYSLCTSQQIRATQIPLSLIKTSIIVPLLYTFEKSIAPVFVSLESDELYLKKDFIQLAESKGISDTVGEKASDIKDSVQREVHITYLTQRAVGSMVYLVLHFFMDYVMSALYHYSLIYMHADSILEDPISNGLLIMVFAHRFLEAELHTLKCLVDLIQGHVTNKKVEKLIFLLAWIVSVAYLFARLNTAIRTFETNVIAIVALF